LYMVDGRVDVVIEQARHRLHGPALIVVPPGVVHGFTFEPGMQGWVHSVTPEHLEHLCARETGWWQRLARPGLWRLDTDLPALTAACEQLRRAQESGGTGRHLVMDAALMQLIWALGCSDEQHNALQVEASTTPLPDDTHRAGSGLRGRFHLQRYRDWIEQHFREQPSVEDAASVLGITATQLNRICREQLGCTALELLHQRAVQEAARDLRFTMLSVQQIAWDLGFADAAYFSRFFRRYTGRSPRQWRDEIQGAATPINGWVAAEGETLSATPTPAPATQ